MLNTNNGIPKVSKREGYLVTVEIPNPDNRNDPISLVVDYAELRNEEVVEVKLGINGQAIPQFFSDREYAAGAKHIIRKLMPTFDVILEPVTQFITESVSYESREEDENADD